MHDKTRIAEATGRARGSRESEIYEDFAKHGLTIIDAIARLEAAGYTHLEAEQLVNEWADHLSQESEHE